MGVTLKANIHTGLRCFSGVTKWDTVQRNGYVEQALVELKQKCNCDTVCWI